MFVIIFSSKESEKLHVSNVSNVSKNKRKKNTESFEPSYLSSDMRVMIGNTGDIYEYPIESRDIILVNNLFPKEEFPNIYECLLEEIKQTGKEERIMERSFDFMIRVIISF